MSQTVKLEDIVGTAGSRYSEPMLNRLDYCRAMLHVNDLIDDDTDDTIIEQIDRIRALVEQEVDYLNETQQNGEEE